MRKLGALGNISSVSSNISSTSPYPNGNWTSNAVANTKDILKVVLVKEVTQQILKVDGLKFNYEAPVVELGGWGRVDGESLGVTTATLKSAGVGCTTNGTIYSNYYASGYAGPAQVGFTVDSKGSIGNLSLISNGRHPDNWGTPDYKPTTWTRNESPRSYSVGVYTSNNDSNYTKNQTITINESQQELILEITSTSAFKYILFKIESTDTIATTMSLKSIGEHFVTKFYIPSKRLSTKYYKYNYANWTRPNLTSNTSDVNFIITDPGLSGGTLSGTTMTWGTSAVTRFTDVWKAFDNSTSTYFTINNGNQTFTVFDVIFSTYMKISGVTINGRVVDSQASSLTGSQIYALKDDGSYALLSTKTDKDVNTHTFTATRTRRLRICARPNTDGGSYPSRLTDITITAQKQSTIESTSSDYDYKVTENKFYLPIRKFNDGTKRLYI